MRSQDNHAHRRYALEERNDVWDDSDAGVEPLDPEDEEAGVEPFGSGWDEDAELEDEWEDEEAYGAGDA
jgi:hypothetical protein